MQCGLTLFGEVHEHCAIGLKPMFDTQSRFKQPMVPVPPIKTGVGALEAVNSPQSQDELETLLKVGLCRETSLHTQIGFTFLKETD